MLAGIKQRVVYNYIGLYVTIGIGKIIVTRLKISGIQSINDLV